MEPHSKLLSLVEKQTDDIFSRYIEKTKASTICGGRPGFDFIQVCIDGVKPDSYATPSEPFI